MLKGSTHTEEARQKMAEAKKGVPLPHTEEWNQKIGQANKGKLSEYIWINNGEVNRRIQKGSELPEGWKVGRFGYQRNSGL